MTRNAVFKTGSEEALMTIVFFPDSSGHQNQHPRHRQVQNHKTGFWPVTGGEKRAKNY